MSFNETAMLVDVQISQYSGRKHDKRITAEVAQAHGAAADAGRYNKLLISKDAIKPVESAAGALRLEHYKYTLPWSDSGPRILPAAAYFDYTAAIASKKQAFEAAADVFAFSWDSYVAEAKQRLNGMFEPADYPARDEVRGRFSVDLKFFPLPDAADFRVQINDAELEKIRQDIQLTVTDRMECAMKDAWSRAHDVVSHMLERLQVYEVDAKGKVKNPFRDSLVANVREIASILPKLNVTGDPQLSATAQEIEFKLCGFDAQELRDSDVARRSAIAAAESILSKCNDYI